MGNLAHLEKMGRELNCPICLSLLSSAVSLNCNHVFCDACIVKSMKLASDCPVCKIPYQRREVRPAPHMDNLVSIYKSMEDASGVNIFMTQSAPSTKSSDTKQQAEDENPDEQDPPKCSQNRAGNKKTVRGKRSAKAKSTLKNSDSVSVKPSFPTKKRVQVPQGPLSETPTRPKQLLGDLIHEKSKQDSMTLKEKPVLMENGEPVLSPFFWLSDKDAENLSQPSTSDQLNDIPSPNVPTFSDIKDSDDEDCTRLSPLGEVQGKSSYVADFFDSEMFEWTQRPCSPELVAGPSMKQVAERNQFDRIQVKEVQELKEASQNKKIGELATVVKARSRNSRQNCANLILSPGFPHDKTEDANHQIVCTQSNKRGRQAGSINKTKFATSCLDLVEDGNASLKGSEDSNQEHGCKNRDNSVAKVGKSNKKGHPARLAAKPTSESDSTGSERQNQGSAEKGLTELPPSLEKSEGDDEAFAQKKAKKICTEINVENQMRRPVRSKKQKVVSMPNMLEVSGSKNKQVNNTSAPDSSHVNVLTDGNMKISKVQNKSSKLDRESKSCDLELDFNKKSKVSSGDNKANEISEIKKQANKSARTELPLINIPTNVNRGLSEVRKRAREVKSCDQELKTTKKVKVSFDVNSKDEAAIEIGEDYHDITEDGNQLTETSKGNPNARLFTDRSSMQKLPTLRNDVVIRRCDAVASKVQCAFCLSSEESEASGEIVHYHNGKPVTADHNGGSKVIHSHRNCTEWAPNVYFEDDIAMNLEVELTRSRRIKCCCCGTKGASLGCFEKSCRKSFHVSCAKMTPECRWDTDNFVMLCPIHASSKLPNESSESQARKKKSNPTKQPGADYNKVHVNQENNTSQDLKFCGSSKKLVLCCSTLTNAEREYVTEFERLSGLTVLKKWDFSITHVVVPTDENGACRRTLKVLMGILEGKWILSMGWIKACLEAKKLVNEEPYEISIDIYGIRDGPRLGRLRQQKKQPKLFDGLKFYFMGDYVPSYKGYLQDLVVAAGGTVLHRKPVPESQKESSGSHLECRTFIIYSLELPDQCHPSKKGTIYNQRQADAKSLASSTGANVASDSWILNSIAACKLHHLSE
ncbi:protein BREAST CANCER SUSCEPTIBILITY 1 homolog [Argentina anserina]|uniref:protein BREAST CANCER SUSCEPTIBILITY 1 homolog n=1 Tax=Argentina anserina TaxID=57926 RepID=UPI0021762AC4|nr:protein BREAST CANCER SUSCEPTIBILITY 1 homolog [Potentilla anserina]